MKPVPARDLPFVDAAAAIASLFVAYAIRALVSDVRELSWSGVAVDVRVAVPSTIAALLLSAAALRLYDERASRIPLGAAVAAAGYTCAVVALVGTYYADEFPPAVVLVSGWCALVALLFGGRWIYWRFADSEPADEARVTRSG